MELLGEVSASTVQGLLRSELENISILRSRVIQPNSLTIKKASVISYSVTS